MLDRYVSGSVNRISPEAPVPVIRVSKEWGLPGGAANVARNVQALGGKAAVGGAVGRDPAGIELVSLLSAQGVETRGVTVESDFQTTVKTRIIAERQQVARVDWEGPYELTPAIVENLCVKIRTMADHVDGIIIEDYGKGIIAQQVVDALLSEAARRGIPVGLDPKDNRKMRFKGVTLATPNYKEALTLAGIPLPGVHRPPDADEWLALAGRRLSLEWDTELLIITLGADGMYLRGRDGKTTIIPTRAREVFDVTGAGDTVIATALLALTCRRRSPTTRQESWWASSERRRARPTS